MLPVVACLRQAPAALRLRCCRWASASSASVSEQLDKPSSGMSISGQADLLMRIAQRLDKKADRLYEGRPMFSDVDFANGSLDEASQIADFATEGKSITTHSTMTIQGRDVQVVYTNDAITVNTWIRDNVYAKGVHVIGLDTEQRPSFWTKPKKPHQVAHKKGAANMAIAAASAGSCAVVQLATADAVLVLHLAHLCARSGEPGLDLNKECDIRHPVGFFATGAPSMLLTLLCDTKKSFAGVNVASDLNSVCRHLRVAQGVDRSSMVVDIDKLARASGIRRAGPGMCHGLESLGHKLMGFPRWKTGALSLSNWSQLPLSQRQVRYAAMDAWAGCVLLHYITAHLVGMSSIEEAQAIEGAYRYLWLHDVAMLPPVKALSSSWLKKRSIQVEDYGGSVLSKSPYLRTRTGRLVLPHADELRRLNINSPLLVPTFRTRFTTNNGLPEASTDFPNDIVEKNGRSSPSLFGEFAAADPSDPATPADGEFWHADRLHPGAKLLLEQLDI